jgi:putative nucleotidyltransferase with HDIG domain
VTNVGRLETYIVSTALAALVALAWAIPQVRVGQALVGIAVVVIVELTASHMRDQVMASLTNVVVLVAVILGGTSVAVVATLGAIPVFALTVSDRRLLRTAFNGAQFALSAATAGLVYGLVVPPAAQFPDAWTLFAIALAAVSFSVVNHALVSVAVATSTSDSFLGAFRSIFSSLALQVPYVGIAVLTGVVVLRGSVWALALMAVPALIARYGLLAFQRLDESYDQLVRTFVKAIEIKDLYTRGHSERVATLSVLVAEELGVPYDQRRLTRYAALLHDVGKIGVPLCIINKPGPLDDAEFAEIKKHPSIGADILHDIDFLGPAIDIVRYHHERLDGRGYPHGVGEAELSDIVRIVTAVDAFDAMTSTRSYRRALAVPEAVAELRRCAGFQFDARMVEALAVVVDRVGWQPTVEFASEAALHGEQIPTGSTQDRFATTSDAPDHL